MGPWPRPPLPGFWAPRRHLHPGQGPGPPPLTALGPGRDGPGQGPAGQGPGQAGADRMWRCEARWMLQLTVVHDGHTNRPYSVVPRCTPAHSHTVIGPTHYRQYILVWPRGPMGLGELAMGPRAHRPCGARCPDGPLIGSWVIVI